MQRRNLLLALLALPAASRARIAAPTRRPPATPAAWRTLVSPAAYAVLFEDATERPHSSPLNDEHRAGTFVCVACHLPLFASADKYDSGTGWPSFTRAIAGHAAFQDDRRLGALRIEYRCVRCGGHQGHRFADGPPPLGDRWCNNGVALRFVPSARPLPALRWPA